MNLLNLLKAHRNEVARDRNRRRVLLGVEDLEVRKVLSTVAPSSGSFEGVAWNYSENATTHVGTLNFTSKAGTDRIQIQAQHTDLSPGDPGYVANSNPVNGVTWTNNDDSGGVNITPGTHVNIVVKENASDDQFINNDKGDFTLTVQARPVAPTTPGTPAPTTPPAPTPASAQSGSTLGLAWRFAPDATGGGTMYVQDVAKGTDSLDSKNQPIAINQSGGQMIFDVDYAHPFYGPSFHAGSQVKVVVAQTSGDISVYDDRNAGTGGLKTEARVQTGNIQVANGRYLSWTLTQNVATQQASFTIASGKTDTATYYIAPAYLNLSPGDPGYVANSNPIVGLTVSDSQGNQGGISFDQGMNVSILTQGGANFSNSSPFKVTKG